MSDYEVTLPDGRSVVVDAPDENGARMAARNFMMREGRTKQGQAGGLDNFVRSLAKVPAMGFADEIAAAADATFGPLVDKFTKSGTSAAPTWNERYTENLGGERAQNKGYSDAHPVWDTAGTVTGGVGGALATLPGFLLRNGTGLVGGLGRSAATGAALGGAQGFGEGEGGFDARLKNAGKGAVVGGAVGGAMYPIAAGVGALGSAIKESKFGRGVADKVIAPGMRWAADKIDDIAPKAIPKSLSAAAPEGTGPLPTGMMADAADTVRMKAPTGDQILDDAAARRIADALQRGGGDVAGMRSTIDDLGPGAMPLDTNTMLTRLGRTAYITPGKAPDVIGGALVKRAEGTGPRMKAVVDETMGDSGPAVIESAKIKAQRAAQGAKDYGAAIGPDAPYKISPQMREIMQKAPVIRETMDRIEANALERGVTLTPAQIAHRVKRQLALDADAAFASGKGVDKHDVGALAERWRSALHDANLAIKEADEAFELRSKALDALDLGRQFMRQGTDDVSDDVSAAVLAKRIPEMSAEEAKAFIAGAADTLKTKLGGGVIPARAVTRKLEPANTNIRDKLVAMIGEDNTAKLFKRAMSERKFASTDRTVLGGSDTASKILSVMDDAASGAVPTSPNAIATRLLGKVAEVYNKQRAGNEEVRARIAKMLTTTDAEANSELLDRIARQLSMAARQPKAVQRGAASAAGQEF